MIAFDNDHFVPARSGQQIEELAASWRTALGVSPNCLQPDMNSIIELEVPRLIPGTSFIVKKSFADPLVEACVEFDPPQICIREDVYLLSLNGLPRPRFTIGHELGHFVMHKWAVPLNRAPLDKLQNGRLRPFESAEWQANAFAAAFLMPARLAHEFECPYRLASAMNVSFTAASNRLKYLRRKK